LLAKNAVKRLVYGARRGLVPPAPHRPAVVAARDLPLEAADPVRLEWPAEVPKPLVGLVKDPDWTSYWERYARFLTTNEIPYDFYPVHRSDWLAAAEPFDIILWRPMSTPAELDECRRKVHVLERHLGKLCYPSLDQAMLYEDKVLQYELLRRKGLPVVDTFVSFDREEIRTRLPELPYPAVWKLSTGSGSLGVELVPDARTALRRARRVFSFTGRRSYWPYVAQKDHVFLQELVPGAPEDVRIIVIGDILLGYMRAVPSGDFRASGMGMQRRGALPEAAMRLAVRAARAFDLPSVAVDMVADANGDYRIIELSLFVQVWSCMSQQVDGVAGYYRWEGEGFVFTPALVWTQELMLREFLRRTWLKKEVRGTIQRDRE
jgi:glutathione synthase/RimK-type ligase-like ATP-grasp enzyme